MIQIEDCRYTQWLMLHYVAESLYKKNCNFLEGHFICYMLQIAYTMTNEQKIAITIRVTNAFFLYSYIVKKHVNKIILTN